MGVVVGQQSGAPPVESELAARLRAEGLSPYGWG